MFPIRLLILVNSAGGGFAIFSIYAGQNNFGWTSMSDSKDGLAK